MDQYLRTETGGEAGLQLLAAWQLISTSPDWMELEFAIKRFRDYVDNGNDYTEMESDIDNICEYEEMISAHGSLLVKIFTLAHFLSRWNQPQSWTDALGSISRQLDIRFGENPGKLNKLMSSLNFGTSDFEQYTLSIPLFDKWKKDLHGLMAFTTTYGKSIDEVQRDWWIRWNKRWLDHLNKNNAGFDPTIDDLICDVTNFRYARIFGYDIGNINKTAWLRFLLDALSSTFTNPARSSIASADNPEAWKIVLALFKLGFIMNSYDAFGLNDPTWRETAKKLVAPVTTSSDFFIMIYRINPLSPLNDQSINLMKKPVLPIADSEWERSRNQIKKLMGILVADSTRMPALIIDQASETDTKADDEIKKIADFLTIMPTRTFRIISPYQQNVRSDFTVIRKLDDGI